MSDFYTVAQCAEKLGVSETTIRRKLKSGELEGSKLGGKMSEWRVDKIAFDAYFYRATHDASMTETWPKEELAKFLIIARKLANDKILRELAEIPDEEGELEE